MPPTPGPGVNVASSSRGLPATQSADDVMKLIKFQGDALGTRTHFDALDPYVKQNFMDMIAEYGKPVQINAAMRSEQEQQTLYDKWIKNVNFKYLNSTFLALQNYNFDIFQCKLFHLITFNVKSFLCLFGN
jgi:hypothetical protein